MYFIYFFIEILFWIAETSAKSFVQQLNNISEIVLLVHSMNKSFFSILNYFPHFWGKILGSKTARFPCSIQTQCFYGLICFLHAYDASHKQHRLETRRPDTAGKTYLKMVENIFIKLNLVVIITSKIIRKLSVKKL